MGLTNTRNNRPKNQTVPLLHHIGKNYRYKMQPDDYDDAVIEAMCAIQRGIETYDAREPLIPSWLSQRI